MNRRSLLKGALAAGSTLLAGGALNAKPSRCKRGHTQPVNLSNGDESRYSSPIASFTKGLPHNGLGEVDRKAWDSLMRALRSGANADFNAIPIGGKLRLVNPQAANAVSLEGLDPQCTSLAPAPAFASLELAMEAAELYWMAALRDVPFAEYESNALVAKASDDLKSAPKTLFRGNAKGDVAGPYISQYLWKEAPYGAIRLVQHVRTATPGLDYLTRYDDWLAMQNGAPAAIRHSSAYRYIRSLRDLAAYVQLDFTYQPFETAALILFGMQRTTDAQFPYKGAPWDSSNPYRGSKTQTGFVTFGVAQALDLVTRAAYDALKASWYHKWLVHRRMRPEEFGGRVHNVMTKAAAYPIHDALLGSEALAMAYDKNRTYLLPQAFAEGAPLHPAYPSGHAVIAGACATVLKAFFDETWPVDDPVVVSADGLALEPYRGETLTVGGELDKLATNIAFGRNAAGIHWRSDAVEGLELGEEVALGLLKDLRTTWHEDFGGFKLARFDGTAAVV